MAESVVGAEVNGTTYNKSEHTFSRSIGGVTKEDTVVLTGEPMLATYAALAKTIITTTSASHIVCWAGDGTNYVRLRRLFVRQVVGATSATLAELSLFRISTAASGGTTVNARPYDAADTNPYGGLVQTLPSSKGTEGTELWHDRLQLLTTAQVAASTVQPNSVEYIWRDGMKPIICGPATTDGIALKLITGIATSTVDVEIEFTVSTYL